MKKAFELLLNVLSWNKKQMFLDKVKLINEGRSFWVASPYVQLK
jgi:hypothetical protein